MITRCCIGICGKTTNRVNGQDETCIWFSLGAINIFHNDDGPSKKSTTVCTPIGTCDISYTTNPVNKSRIITYGICTLCGSYTDKHEDNGTREISINTLCYKHDILTTPPQINMLGPLISKNLKTGAEEMQTTLPRPQTP